MLPVNLGIIRLSKEKRLNKNNKASKKEKIDKKRKPPARGQLVARSMRGGNQVTLTGEQVKTKPKSPRVSKSPVNKTKQLKKKSPNSHLQNAQHIFKPLQHAQSTSSEKGEGSDKEKKKKLLVSLEEKDESPTRYYMAKAPKEKSCYNNAKTREPTSSRTIKQQQSFENIKDWPSLEQTRKKGGFKEAATELVKNKQAGTVTHLSKHKRAGLLSPKQRQCASKPSAAEKQTQQKSWATVVGSSHSENMDVDGSGSVSVSIPSTSVNTRQQMENKNKGILVTGKRSRDNILSTPAMRKQTIQKRRETQRQKAVTNVSGSEILPTTSGQNHGLLWNIDHMPDNLRCVNPPNRIISIGSEIHENNINMCSNAPLLVQNLQPPFLFQSNTLVDNPCSGHQKVEADICHMMGGASFFPEHHQSTSNEEQINAQQRQYKKHNCKHKVTGKSTCVPQTQLCENDIPQKRVSERYRALMRKDSSRQRPDEYFENLGSNKLAKAPQERRSLRTQNMKKRREEILERSRIGKFMAGENCQSAGISDHTQRVTNYFEPVTTAQNASKSTDGESPNNSSVKPALQEESRSLECSAMEVDTEPHDHSFPSND